MEFTIALAQCRRPDDGDVIASVRSWARRAARAGASLVVFPEALMTGFDGSIERFTRQAQPLDGTFATTIDEIASNAGLWVVYTMNERRDDEPGADEAHMHAKRTGLPFNTAVMTDDAGIKRGVYRKVHLFDAQGERESKRMSAGDALMEPVHAPFATIGLGICYDLRFPEVARAAALSGADLMLYPAAWMAGPGKIAQWETLLRARAIENGMFVAGACCVDAGRAGHSCVFAPDGTLLADSDGEERLVICEIERAEVERIRSVTPALLHRRPECY